MAKAQTPKFTANVLVNVVVEVPLQATTFEEAIAEAKGLNTPDVVKPIHQRYFADFNPPVVSMVSTDAWLD